MSAERRGAMPTRARCVKLLRGHPARSGRFTSSMTRPLGNHARKVNGTCQNRKPMRNGESQALVAESCLESCGKLQELPWKGLRKGLKGLMGLKAGKEHSCLGKACVRV